MKTESKKPILQVKAINCPKLQQAINQFFNCFDTEHVEDELQDFMMQAVISCKDYDRKSIANAAFCASQIMKLVRVLENHYISPKARIACQN